MRRMTLRSTRTDTLCPYSTLFRSRRAFFRPQALEQQQERQGQRLLALQRGIRTLAVGGQRLRQPRAGVELAFGLGPAQPIQIGRATSELQSLMRSSYAVFCLKNKTPRPP